VIADDEALMREQLRARLAEVWPELEIVPRRATAPRRSELVAAERPDVVFLDIRMPAKAASRPPARSRRSRSVPACRKSCASRLHQYAIDAFEQGVIDYVLKPAERERLALTVERHSQALAARRTMRKARCSRRSSALAGRPRGSCAH